MNTCIGSSDGSLTCKELEELTDKLKINPKEIPNVEIPESILLRKGPLKKDEIYYKILCIACESLFLISNNKIHYTSSIRVGGNKVYFYCSLCQRVQGSEQFMKVTKEYVQEHIYRV